MDKIITYLAEKFAGRLVTKGVTILATYLVTHSLLDPAKQTGWTGDTAQIITGAVLMGVSFLLSHKQQAKTTELIQTALYTPPPAVGMGATEIVNRPTETKP
jgi:riboflavin transporter FmnP